MFDAAFKALGQMFTPPFRAALLKSIGLSILLLVMFGFGLHRLFGWLADEGAQYLEGFTGPGMQTPLHALLWALALMAGFGLFAPVPVWTASFEGIKTALLALLVYLCAVPLVLFAGFGFIIFFVANCYLLGREYFLLAAMRFHSVEEAKALRRRHHGTVVLAGAFIAAFVSIPVLNLATPLFGMAFMTHMHKKLVGPQRELITHT
jgi:CysZ protein